MVSDKGSVPQNHYPKKNAVRDALARVSGEKATRVTLDTARARR
jgi:hypothetical protein